MKIRSIEPTPSPNVMKLNMDESLPAGISRNFTKEKLENAPDYIQKLLSIDGVKGVFQVADFISLERNPKNDWRNILHDVQQLFGDAAAPSTMLPAQSTEGFGEVQVLIQMFRGIPLQIKLAAGSDEMRFGLPERFSMAAMKLRDLGQNYILERKWEEQSVRYGTFKEIGEEIIQELSASYDEGRIADLIAVALGEENEEKKAGESSTLPVNRLLEHPDWEKRFAALERMNPTIEDIPLLSNALGDPKTSIRRLATVYLGMIGKPEVLPHLFRAMKDSSAAVRRTAGDALSDLGDPRAIPPMIEALGDSNKLVRWRAARFLFEVGDETAIPALQQAQEDPEFEVSLQAKMALERLERGEEASGTIWQQMTRNRKE